MSSLPTLPRRSWLERISLALGIVLAAVGILTMTAWWLGVESILQPFANRVPLEFNAALAFTVIGGALIALEFGPRRLALCTIVSGMLAAITVAEHGLQRDFGIDELFVRYHLPPDTPHPGRMAVMLALGLLAGSAVLAWRALNIAARGRLAAEAVIGSVMAAAGFATLLGYLVAMPVVYSWGTETATGPVAGFALFVLGVSLVLLAWRESAGAERETPAWSPVPFIIGCLTLTAILWVGLRDNELSYVQQKTRTASEALAQEIALQLDQDANRLERVARRRADVQDDIFTGWESDVQKEFDELGLRGAVLLAYLDTQGRTAWFHPREGNEGAPAFDHRSVVARADALDIAGALPFDSAVSNTLPIVVPALRGVRKGVAIYAPVLRGTQVTGFVAGDFIYEGVFAAARRQIDPNYNVEIALGGEVLYASSASDTTRNENIAYQKTYTIADRPFRITLTPSDAALAIDRRSLPELALAAGFGLTALLGLSVHLARSARAGQRAAELSNKKLFAENEERRRVEARLKVSDERLRLALDSTQIGIFEWSVSAGHVYYSPGLWAMLGYEHGRMPSTVEAWQSLIHPDDLPLYRRRIESQLAGIATFIEPEYRVQARSGDWRWVYTRSKSVAANPDGRPTRIIGTVQDITARREAEIALRESQAEARKLSLVAAKTDNPVLITSPEGKIEWVNEAFCRVMEYSLDEIIGKNPGDFMVGRDTSSRTITRIRAAMARGHGISTDVVNYSKSGRKYHLHIEVQPIRGVSGNIENFIAVETDITARVETENQLRRAKADADDASRAKSEFLASMSHEIRTPMNGVIGMTSLLMETTLSVEQRDFVNTIRTSGEALLTIINDILDFSKIESGKMELERSPFELALCLEEALDLFALQASAKKIEIGYLTAPDVPAYVIGDVTRLRQILVNLVNNAVKFTPSGSVAVEVRGYMQEPAPLPLRAGDSNPPLELRPVFMLEFRVTDTGIGIPTDRLERLFKAFSQVDSSTTRKYGGTGLGLAICQRLVELMGGTIRVESKEGEGSTFIFTIQTEPATEGTESGLSRLPSALRRGTALCVAHHPVTQKRIRAMFEKWGGTCVIVPDATAGLRTAAEWPQPPALLIADIQDFEAATPLGTLASLTCPRLVLFPFGQTAPAVPDDGLPFASLSKPIRTGLFLHALTGLFQARMTDSTATATANERPIAELIPLEVLLAEDNAVNQKVALRFLERLGYRAEAVGNGLEAITALENRRYDLVLMDLQMPEMDGFEASRQIRARLPAERQPRIIALTANAMQGDRELCLAAGMDDHVSKPVKMHEIAAAIRKHFGKNDQVPSGSDLIG